MDGAVFSPCCLTWDQTMVEVMKIMVNSFKRSHTHTAAFSAPHADPRLHQRLLDSHRKLWVSLSWGHCSFLLGPGVHMVLFVFSQSLFPQSCVNSDGSMLGLLSTSSKKAYATPRSVATWAPAHVKAHNDPYLYRRQSNTQRQVWSQFLWDLLVCSWWALWAFLVGCSLILNVIFPLLPSCWGFSFVPGHGVSFFWWDPTFSSWWLFSSEL